MNNVFLDVDIYPIDCIQKAIDDYKDYANISLIELNSGVELVFNSSVYDLEVTTKEFCNYLIELTAKKHD